MFVNEANIYQYRSRWNWSTFSLCLCLWLFLDSINENKSIFQAKISLPPKHTLKGTFNWNESKNCFWYLIFFFFVKAEPKERSDDNRLAIWKKRTSKKSHSLCLRLCLQHKIYSWKILFHRNRQRQFAFYGHHIYIYIAEMSGSGKKFRIFTNIFWY